ncbi:MAG TPA: hypothetical protein VFS33_06665 [Gemmatimonadales bacterium]|nr:hypothetical protein [Gemmatimonadales bacterium]
MPALLFLLGAGALVAAAASPPRPGPDGWVADAAVNGWALLGVAAVAVSVPALLTRCWRRLRAQAAGDNATA